MNRIQPLTMAMIRWFGRDTRRVQHFLKVWAFARTIGQAEGLSEESQRLLESAALTHDIGIRTAEARYGRSSGKYQEELGPDDARPMLEGLGYAPAEVERICWLIGHHHTYGLEGGPEYQILLEADFLVNAAEEPYSLRQIRGAEARLFRTGTGKALLNTLYLQDGGENAGSPVDKREKGGKITAV